MTKIRGFIIEGADQQGKTFVSEYIQRCLGWKIKHFPPPTEDFNFFSDYILPEKMISDRNFLSEIVYSKVKGHPHRIKRLTELQLQLNRRGVVILVLDRENCNNLEDRDELYSLAQIRSAIWQYKLEFNGIQMEKYYINPEASEHLIGSLIRRAL
jgi:hypothetical protein